ncbi:MAG: class I SAM-dependent methyltransferase [Lachnospiraceae bacterium]|nr:class I SAM-dependent methyltransferase [Lachnospiraceae bacterium]
MMNNKGFDLWADGYDVSVGLSDEANIYPFAGYKQVLNRIYQQVLEKGSQDVLDIGFGTGTLTAKLYDQGCRIWGLDFSARMIELAREKMPQAVLVQGDFAQGLPEELRQQKYDAIIATYSLHHLDDDAKVGFLNTLLFLLKPNGKIYVGDVAFETRTELEACRADSGEEWDDEEIYFVYNELKEKLSGEVMFEKISHCAGIIALG